MKPYGVRIYPQAGNSFNIEVIDYMGEVAYTLEVHTDGNRMGITAKDNKGEITDLQAVLGFFDVKGNKKFKFNHLTIEPLGKEA